MASGINHKLAEFSLCPKFQTRAVTAFRATSAEMGFPVILKWERLKIHSGDPETRQRSHKILSEMQKGKNSISIPLIYLTFHL